MNRSEKILIVEDERIIALDLQRRLERFGFTIAGIASSGEEAITRAGETNPDMILMDIMLEGRMDGIEAADVIKNQHQIPVIFLTAYADEKTLERAKRVEPFGYILKPFKEKELFTTIDISLYKNRMNRKLMKHERWFSAILNSIGDGIIATDQDGKIQFMNPVAETLTGWREAEAQNKSLKEVFVLLNENTMLPLEIPELSEENRLNEPLFFDNILLKNHIGAYIHVEGSISEIVESTGSVEGIVIAFRDISRIKNMKEILSYQQSHDLLTGLANREEFYQKLNSLAVAAKQKQQSHSLIYLDLDQFKIINDICGHIAGDELLRQVSGDIMRSVPSDAVSARLGGDEFAIIVPNNSLRDAYPIAQAVRDQLNQKFIWQKNLFNISASISLVPVNAKTTDIYSVLAAADDACYLAKEEGGNRIKVYENTDYRFLKRRGEMQWISKLTRALEENNFCLYFQPIIPLDGTSGNRPKYEILLRLKDTDGTCIQPMDFIPSAEKYNLMPAIDRWVIRETIRQYNEMKRQDDTSVDRLFCINISGSSLADQSLLDYILEQFTAAAVDPEAFCFEITETTAISNLSLADRFMRRLKQIGCTFALDDFGSGFSSLAYLKSLPVDFLKIDGTFIKDIYSDPIDCAMVEAINNIGHVMGLKTIAEFVADCDIRNKLRSMGVDYAQGYEIAHPKPLSDLSLTG